MKVPRLTIHKVGLYACTLLAIVLSVLWWFMGLSMASAGVDGGSSIFL